MFTDFALNSSVTSWLPRPIVVLANLAHGRPRENPELLSAAMTFLGAESINGKYLPLKVHAPTYVSAHPLPTDRWRGDQPEPW